MPRHVGNRLTGERGCSLSLLCFTLNPDQLKTRSDADSFTSPGSMRAETSGGEGKKGTAAEHFHNPSSSPAPSHFYERAPA